MNNLAIAQRLRALAEAVKNAPQEWGTVGVGGDTVEKLVFIEHENVQVLEVRLTPPPAGNGQNVGNVDDDDADDGVIKVHRPFAAGFSPTSEMISDLCDLNIWQKGLEKFLKETGDK